MASKHAALYFEAYKQHHLVCSSLHTLSCEVSRVQGGGGGGNGRVPASSSARQARLKPKTCAIRPSSPNARRTPVSRRTLHTLCTVQTAVCRIALPCKCSLYHKRLVLGITNGCRLRNRHAPLDADTYILDFSHESTHARTLMTDDG